MKKINCIIIEDEYLARLKLKGFAEQVSELNILGSYATLREAQNSDTIDDCTIFFLDISLPDGNGLEFAKKIAKESVIIFTTAYSEYAVDGFNLNATDYLLKPIEFSRFKVAIAKAMNHISLIKAKNRHIILKQGRSLIKCDLQEVFYIKGMQEYLYWKTSTGKIITLGSLTSYAEELQSNNFIRVHKSFIVNLTKIESVTSKTIIVNEQEIPLGATFKNNFINRYKNIFKI